jgi:hypothetical protein
MADGDALLPQWWREGSGKLSSHPAVSADGGIAQLGTSKLDAPAISAALCQRGFTVVDGFLGAAAATAVRKGIASLNDVGALRPGKIQHGTRQDASAISRTDRIAFLPPVAHDDMGQPCRGKGKSSPPPPGQGPAGTVPSETCSVALLAYSRVADQTRALLNAQPRLVECVNGALDACNFMCALYPGGGARYVKHRDALPYKAGRKLTMIYYINAGWQPGHGGELRLWPADEAPPVVIEPHADRLLLFISSLEHEVLPAWRPRYALTTWMFNRRDTALEVLAEEMRERKAAGRLNTQALLAALDADSSSDDGSADGDEDGGEGPSVDRKAAMAVMAMLMKRKQDRKQFGAGA